jgi:hypothetical protein
VSTLNQGVVIGPGPVSLILAEKIPRSTIATRNALTEQNTGGSRAWEFIPIFCAQPPDTSQRSLTKSKVDSSLVPEVVLIVIATG